MRALVQRVTTARVTVDGEETGSIGPGLCVLVGATHTDRAGDASKLASRIWNLRVFPDADGLVNLSAAELAYEVLVVSQFTLYADTSRGRRPSFVQAAQPEVAQPLVEAVVRSLQDLGARVATGRFGASMQVEIVNDGPFTVMLDTAPPAPERHAEASGGRGAG